MAITAESALESASIDASVGALRPDYRALIVVAEQLRPGPSDADSEAFLAEAEAVAHSIDLEADPRLIAWRDAFRAFGAKPQRTRPSVDGLLRRVAAGLPRIDRLTDAYNAVSVQHVVPVGGEDLAGYVGRPRLTRAVGDEPFDTTANGEPATEYPDSGEVIWRDDAGATCRRWNWRQCVRTRLTEQTTSALFVVDALGALSDSQLDAAGHALIQALLALSPDARVSSRLVSGPFE